jgi:WD40 repeat protein
MTSGVELSAEGPILPRRLDLAQMDEIGALPAGILRKEAFAVCPTADGRTCDVQHGNASVAAAPFITSLAWSPDGTRLAISTTEGDAYCFSLDDGFPQDYSDAVDNTPVYDLAWNPAGDQLATAGRHVRIWETNSGDQIKDLLHVSASALYCVSWSRGGEYLLTGNENGHVLVWRPGKADLGLAASCHENVVTAVAWCPNPSRSSLFAVASADFRVSLWDVDVLRPTVVWNEHDLYATAVAWYPDGARLASAAGDRSVCVYDCDRRALESKHADLHKAAIRALAVSCDGTYIATSALDHTVKIWRTADWQCLATFERRCNIDNFWGALTFHPKHPNLLAMLYAMDTGVEIIEIAEPAVIVCPACTRDLSEDVAARKKLGKPRQFMCPHCDGPIAY